MLQAHELTDPATCKPSWVAAREVAINDVVDIMHLMNRKLSDAGLYADFDDDKQASATLLAAATAAYFQPTELDVTVTNL